MIVKCVVVLNAPSYNVHSDKTSYFISHGHFWTALGTTVNAPDIKNCETDRQSLTWSLTKLVEVWTVLLSPRLEGQAGTQALVITLGRRCRHRTVVCMDQYNIKSTVQCLSGIKVSGLLC